MQPLISRDLWQWIEDNRESFRPPVGNKVIWEDSQFTAMVIAGPNRRRDFHDSPSDEIFYQLQGDIILEYVDPNGQRQNAVIRQGEIFLAPCHTPHAPHRPPGSWGLVIERKRGPADFESLRWFCDGCNAELHRVTMNAFDIEAGLKGAIEAFDASADLRTCKRCGHVQPEHALEPASPVSGPLA
jgi:3-hydroxyanthranilate 3,4-dioxygenase